MTSARRLRGALAALVVALLAGALLGGLPAGADGPVATTVAADGTPDVVDEDDSTGPTGSTSAGGGLPVVVWLLLGLAVVAGLLLLLRTGTLRRDGERAEHRRHELGHEGDDSEHI